MDINSSWHSQDCDFPVITIMFSSITVLHILMVPILVFILFVGFQRWRKQLVGSNSMASNHIDIFTYNMVILELLGTSGFCFNLIGLYTSSISPIIGSSMFGIFSVGDMLFQLLTCIERCLAVVHPLYYLRFRGREGARIRNITIGCVWLISVGLVSITSWQKTSTLYVTLVLLSLVLVIVCLCSVSVLFSLIRPGPGETGNNKRICNQSKKRVLQLVVIITGTLFLRFISGLLNTILQTFSTPYGYMYCVAGISSTFFLIPSSLVLPLLFLQRVGKIQICGKQPDTAV